jgi:hypothetical protein
LAPRQLKPFISQELLDGPLRPIDYVEGDRVVRGYDASILVAVCGVWLEARKHGALQNGSLPLSIQGMVNPHYFQTDPLPTIFVNTR